MKNFRSIIINVFITGSCLRHGFLAFVLVFLASTASALDFKVQRGNAVIAAGNTTLTLNAPADFTAVSNLSKAFVRITNSQHTGAGNDTGGGKQHADRVSANIQFNATDQITITRFGSSGTTVVYWEIVEYVGAAGGDNEFVVRAQGVLPFGSASSTATATYSTWTGASTAKLAGFVTGVANPDAGRNLYETQLVTSSAFATPTQLELKRGGTGTAIEASYAVVDFIGANWTVQRVEHTYTNANVVETETLATAVGLNASFIHAQKRNASGLKGLDEFGHQVWLSATNTVSFQLMKNATNPAGQTSVAWVVSNPDMSVYRTNGSRAKNTGSEPDIFTVTVPAVAVLNNSSLFINNDSTGTGTVFPRTIMGAELKAVDTVELFRSDNGQTQNYRIEVVQWPATPAFTIDGTVYTDEAKTTTIAAGKTLSLSVNGAAVVSTTTQADGTFSFGLSVAPNPNDVLLIYLDGETEKGSLVTKTDGVTDLTGANALELVVGKVILENQVGTTITNTDLDVIDGVDAGDDDGITITSGNASFASGFEVWISSGDIYAPGGDVTLVDLEIFGTLDMAGNTLNVTGSVTGSGSINPGTSTVNFTGSVPVTLSGNLAFNDFICTVPSKAFTVTTGSTITVNGKFLIDGDDFGTRITFASSGGTGTTWNLVLNGTHDCRYVAVQGSTIPITSTAFLPINPVGYKNNGDNTNWYDSALPPEMLFFDNFETSTLGSSPPDKTSSNWNISTASWLDQAAVVVNTHNHTSGGSQSMYSSGGAANVGIGAWNSPQWGPQTNCTAEAWFYDDMQNTKMQWLFIDNAAGNQGIGILVETNKGKGATKYRYCRFNFGGGTLYEDSYIDRTLGWHKATWIHTDGTVTLYIDGAQVMTASGLSDFSAFDTGSWNWHNTTGSTPMWFDDFIVYRSQHQSAYRWYDNDSADTPTALAAEDTAISRDMNSTTRLRIQIQNDQYEAWSGERIGLQYREGSNGTWTMLSAGGDWSFVDNGFSNDGTLVALPLLLTNSDVREYFVGSVPSAATQSMTNAQYGEWDFSIMPTSNATIGVTYYIRPVITDASGDFARTFAAYTFTAECQVTSPTMKQWTGANSSDWNDPGNWASPGVPDATYDVVIPAGTPNCRVNISGATAKSVLVEDGGTLLLDTPATNLTVVENMTVYGTVTHSNDTATLTINSGTLRVEGNNANYNHTGNGAINAANAAIEVINGGSYNVSGSPVVTAATLHMSVGGLINVTGAATMNVDDFTIDLNGQWLSSNIGNTVNIANNFVNNGSMLGSAGGVFNFNGTGKTMGGASTTTTFYQANFNGTTTSTITNDILVLDDLTINAGKSFTASTGLLKVGGDWTNNGGTFANGGGTVELNGSALQQITADGSDFNNLLVTNASVAGVSFLDGFATSTLVNTTPASTMTFHAGDAYAINAVGGLQLAGTAGNEITLASSSPGTFWKIDPVGGSWSVDYVNVADSVNLSEITIFPTNSTDSGHNINWFSSDQDKDHLPDYWEYKYYNGLANPLINNAESNTDSDDLSAIEEYVLDTNPTIPNVNIGDVLFVDDNAGYIGDGTVSAPFKYLKDALDAATDGTLISLAEGTYELDDYALSKRVLIRGAQGPFKTIIRGAAPDGTSSDFGQMLNVSGKNFMLSKVTLRLFRDDKPIISYDGAGTTKIVIFNNLIFRDNNTQTKSLIAPSTTKQPFKVYMLNCLVYSNSALSAGELGASKAMYAFNNTIVNNTFASTLMIEGKKDAWLTNSILRNSTTEITDNTDGDLYVSNSNVEGTIPATAITVGNYDSVETFANSTTGAYQLLSGSPGVDFGLTTELTWDINDSPRPQGSAYDVGAFELDPNDSDGDGLTDTYENNHGLNQDNPDTDGDGLTDGEEISKYGTNPLNKNTDGDYIDDGDEPAMGMDPAVPDGDGDIDGVYYTSFESEEQFPTGAQMVDTIWGHNGNANNSGVIVGQVTIENIGAAAYEGSKVAKCAGQTPESSYIGWVDRNNLDNYWISIAWKMPRAKLPTDINEAFNIAGAFLAIDENGYLNIYNPKVDPPDPSPAVPPETWIKDTVVIPENTWITVTVHRDHPGKTVDVWLDISGSRHEAFPGVPTSGPDPTAGTGKFRMSMSSVGEQDVFTDLWSALPFAPF